MKTGMYVSFCISMPVVLEIVVGPSVAEGILVVQAVDKVQKVAASDVEVQVEFVEQVVVRDQVRL